MDSLSTRLAELRKKALEASEEADKQPAIFVKPNLTGMTVTEGVLEDFTVMSECYSVSDIVDLTELETPLWVLLIIYEKAHRACGIDYNKGLNIVIKWLAPIALPADQPNIKYPDLLIGWDTSKLAPILGISIDVIIACILKEVIPRLSQKVTPND